MLEKLEEVTVRIQTSMPRHNKQLHINIREHAGYIAHMDHGKLVITTIMDIIPSRQADGDRSNSFQTNNPKGFA